MPYYEHYHHPKIDDTTEELCEDCRGAGRTVWCHRMIGGHQYHTCDTCNGTGKTIKRPKCKVHGCEKKQAIRQSYTSEGKIQELDPDNLCEHHSEEIQKIKNEIEEEQKSITVCEQQLQGQKQKVAEMESKIAAILGK